MASALAMRAGVRENQLLARLGEDERIPLDLAGLQALLADKLSFTGAASSQVAEVVRRVEAVATAYPQAAKYTPGDIL